MYPRKQRLIQKCKYYYFNQGVGMKGRRHEAGKEGKSVGGCLMDLTTICYQERPNFMGCHVMSSDRPYGSRGRESGRI
jgi:hypothetical protein